MTLYNRKRTRLENYDYSSEGYYFITICTHEKKCIFGKPGQLNAIGEAVENCIGRISEIYPQVLVDNSIVMPNHIHLILALQKKQCDDVLPNISHVIGQFKMSATKNIRNISLINQVWQRSFHDHVIRNQREYEKIWNYVEYNDQKWAEDCFYTEEFR